MKLRGATFVMTVALALSSVGCGSSEDGKSSNLGSGTGGGSTGGVCLNGSCGGCTVCFDDCVCETGNVDACVQACMNQSSGGTGGSGQAGSGGSGIGGTGGDPGAGGALTGDHQVIELKMQPFSLGPGEETFKCQNFANPMGNQDLVFVKTESFMTAGSHHMFVMENNTVQSDSGLYECSGLDFKPLVHSAQTPQVSTNYPAGVGERMPAGTGFQVLAHYFNTSTSTVNAEVRVLLYVANPGEVTRYAAAVFGNSLLINVAPYSQGTASGGCSVPENIELLHIVSHMHSHAVNFEATLDGQQLYQTDNWDDPVARVFQPPMSVNAGSRISYKCDYNNTTGDTLTFGESAKSNEMCIISGRAIIPSGNGVSCVLGF